jgi:hypothetical protein
MSSQERMGTQRRLATVLAVAAASGLACQSTTAPSRALAVRCSANPSAGPAPLSVVFSLDVANARGTLRFSINYGDGTQGTDPDARHVYAAAGDFVASFTVTAGVDTARCSVPVAVAAPAPTPTPTPEPTPEPDNAWPDAWFITNPAADADFTITGTAPLTVAFNMCRSADPDGDPLYFRMDLDGDGSYELYGATGADCRHETTYAIGTRTAKICVTDVNCPSWPSCNSTPRFHPFQCQSYTVTATP